MILNIETVDVTPKISNHIMDVTVLSSTEYKHYRKSLRWNLRKNLLNRGTPRWFIEKEQEINICYDESLERIFK